MITQSAEPTPAKKADTATDDTAKADKKAKK
jgi:hypothetical protein